MVFVIPQECATEPLRRPEKAPKQPKIAPCWFQTKPEQQKKYLREAPGSPQRLNQGSRGAPRRLQRARTTFKRPSKRQKMSLEVSQVAPRGFQDCPRDSEDASRSTPGVKKHKNKWFFYDFCDPPF